MVLELIANSMLALKIAILHKISKLRETSHSKAE